MDNPTWKQVPRYEGIYSVSDAGLIRRDAPSPIGRGITKPGRLLKLMKAGRSGYYRVRLFNNGCDEYIFVHRIVCEAFNGKAPSPKHVANHLDGDKWNNGPTNLEWATASENSYHAFRTGLAHSGDKHWINNPKRKKLRDKIIGCLQEGRKKVRGENHHSSKLNDKAVNDIRKHYVKGKVPLSHFAKKYGVDKTLISLVVKRRIWTHV